MLTKITDELWLDLEKIIRVAVDGQEIKYTINFMDRMVTYCIPLNVGAALLSVLDEMRIRNLEPIPSVEDLLEQELTSNGDEI